jgi:hypothetical protein
MSLLQGAMGGCMCVEGATDAAVFEAYVVVEEVLAPSLRASSKGRWCS